MFDSVDPRQSFPSLERGILKYWREEDIFKRSIHQRSKQEGDPLDGRKGTSEACFSFYDGPPFATGLPHYGHLLAGTIKDVIPRYRTMRGNRVDRRFGWDCHGLPIENIIEKEHGIKSKREIEAMGVKAFNDLCRTAVQRYTKEWRVVVERMGRWVDMDHDYRTMDPEYMESIWWVFASLAEKKLIYEGHKPMHICVRCATPLSNFEVTQGYKDRTDLSVIVTFPLKEDPSTVLLAWTTTPWSLPGNMWLAIDPHFSYVAVKAETKRYILAEKLVKQIFAERPHEIEGPVDAKALIGKDYLPLFPYFVETLVPSTEKSKKPRTYGESAFRIVSHKEIPVSDTEGTGIVHLTSSTGEDSFVAAKAAGVDVLPHVTMDGHFIPAVTDFASMQVKPEGKNPMSTDKVISECLEKRGRRFSEFPYSHSYPHCWRCDTPLIPYVTSSWFVSVEKIKQKMLQTNAETEWVPSHIRDGRFGKWLENARDWAISRSRYWGTPLPIWRCDETGEMEVIGSRDDLMKRKPIRFTKVTVLRHGESEGNVSPRYQGKEPGTDLTAKGKKQVKATAERLSHESIAQIYCSPLARTKQTADIIAKETEAEMMTDARLREVEFGEYEGKTIDFSDLTIVKARRAHKLETGKMESIYHFPGMETWKNVHARMSDFLMDVLPRHRGEHIVIVTHADPLQNIRTFFTGEDPVKISHQPYPGFAEPFTFYWDHDTGKELDLHKETVDGIAWPGSPNEKSVDVTIVRHGETEWNKERKVHGGDVDEPLNDEGKKQARELATKLAKKKFDVILSSDLKRTAGTATILSKELGVPIGTQWPELRERKTGEWSGTSIDDVMKKHSRIHEKQSPVSHHATPPGGESLSEFLQRMERAYDRLLEEFPGKKILIVAHKGVIQGLATLAENLTHKEAVGRAKENAELQTLTLHPLLRRIPEVLDCWFESGSMPYAQGHFPFALRTSHFAIDQGEKGELRIASGELPPGFPADFIAEGIDQTRGWFYTLTVLAAALFKLPAFRHCIVNGTVLAEDGKKMSKRLKNYPEPLEVVEKHGADAVRFALMSSPAVRGEDLRFSEKIVVETVRSVLLPLWNTYAFFVTYANAANWKPSENRRHSMHPLDIWIRAEVQDLVNRMTEQLDAYDLSATCAELYDTIDALTNWYVRLSRRRFAGKSGIHEETTFDDHGEDRSAALQTLFDVLLTLCQLLAPFCPFITEAIYLNLVPEEHGSIHLTDWPAPRALTKEEKILLKRTRLLRMIVALGLSVRAEQKVKLRQPLAKATVAIPSSLREGGDLTAEELRLLQEELNVKAIELMDDPGSLAHAIAQVDARKVGPRLGARVQEIIAAGKRGDFTVKENGEVLIGDDALSPEEVTIVYRGKEGENVAADRGIVVSLDMTVTPELRKEGLLRDLTRAIQKLRKEEGFSVTDRVTLSIDGADELIQESKETIERETNVVIDGKVEGAQHVIEMDDDHSVTIFFAKRK
ncbi:class I tRNA ligase family protein [Candidatus Peregrinibacteria bacterium]|nr:class I tRNA ligase family protein [Candidatus Peregrinibacteria bacterium]